MDSNDKKIKSIMTETLKELVVPRLEKIEKKQEKHDERFNRIEKKLQEHDGQLGKIDKKLITHDEKLDKIIKKLDITFDAVGDTKVEVTILQENISDQGYTLERIETKLDSTVHRQDDFSIKADQLNRRVLRLESKKA